MTIYKAKARFAKPRQMPFVIYYQDGTSFSSEKGQVREAPKLGVIRIEEEGKDGLERNPFYVKTLAGWLGRTEEEMTQDILYRLPKIEVILAGVAVH